MCDHKNCNNEAEVHIELNIGIKSYNTDLCKKCAKSILINGLANNIGFELKSYEPIQDAWRNVDVCNK